MGKDFDWDEICQADAMKNECYSYIPRVGVVDSRDRDIAEDKSDPSICLPDHGHAHIPVTNTVSIIFGCHQRFRLTQIQCIASRSSN
jgi:hypothetical protein